MTTKQITARASIGVNMDMLSSKIYEELRYAGLIRFTNPSDDLPHFAMTSAEFRCNFQRAINGLELHLVID
jgi:hypothetical protein